MASSMGLNPRAPEYIPLSYTTTQTHFSNFPPLEIHIRHFPFPSPPPPPPSFFPFSQSPLLQPQPMYTTPSFPNHPPPRPPPPPPVVEPPPTVRVTSPDTVRIGGPRRRPPRSLVAYGRGNGFRSSHRHRHPHPQKEPNFGRSFRNGSSSGGSGGERRRGTLKKHEVLPLTHWEEKTTVMIKNIPKHYTGELLLRFLDEHCLLENRKRNTNSEEDDDCTVSAYDFMYLPIDFRTGFSRGFAFVNFTEARAVWKFFEACNRKTWELFQSPKICEIVCAKIQGKEALVKHFQNSTFRCESDQFLPVCFSPPRDGSSTELVEEIRIGKRI
ncbi:hypothetical protein Vadar_022427 [Vaccinium darrowii]|uniref:Uncharacterized protein n=1 Tax=Vaccinium darrowii TaxID=229202 RepID=A0ACB7X2X5_9ERIC|nr:hypothetical protein Vadar_022427 [Vaccinium darrowii]